MLEMSYQLLLLLISLLLLLLPACSIGQVADSTTEEVFVLGCNGDLAQRYLWPAFRQIQQERPQLQLHCVIRGSLSADSPGGFLGAERAAETGALDWFFNNVRLHPGTRDEAGYGRLCSQENSEPSQPNRRRIFYLSIPPRSYAEVVRALQRACPSSVRPNEFVLEKPFGSDAETAKRLAEELAAAGVAEEHLYRVDHYLAKPVLAGLTQFRQANSYLESLLSSAYVTQIEAAILESLGVEDRVSFYDSEGVIRDVMQNHLTEMLSLLLMDLPPSEPPPPGWLESEKARILTAFCPLVGEQHLLAGRYSGYGSSSATPTFAVVGLTFCRSARWQSVPVVASAGKRLAFKASYVRLRFQLPAERHEDELLVYVGGDAKSTGLTRPLIACSSGLHCRASTDYRLLSSKEAVFPNGNTSSWLLRHPQSRYEFFGSASVGASEDAYVQVARQLLSASSSSGVATCFVGLPSLLASWHLWDLAVAAAADLAELQDDDAGLRVYKQNWLPDFSFDLRGRLRWPEAPSIKRRSKTEQTRTFNSAPKVVRFDSVACDQSSDCNFLLHSGSPMSLSKNLALRIAVKVKEVAADSILTGKHQEFHLALPGGQSAQLLMQSLAAMSRDDHVLAEAFSKVLHIWATDERCVLDGLHSDQQNESIVNWAVINYNLIQQLSPGISLSRSRLHFPRINSGNITGCIDAANAYSSEIIHWLSKRSSPCDGSYRGFDFVVLGVGADGHSASLFTDCDLNEFNCTPSSNLEPPTILSRFSRNSDKYSIYFDKKDSTVRQRADSSAQNKASEWCEPSVRVTRSPNAPRLRISLSSSELARAQEVAFILTGKAKQSALDLVSKRKLPVFFRLLLHVGNKKARLWLDRSLKLRNIVS